MPPSISTLFVDIGGVLLTDGWDRHARERAADHFKLDLRQMEDRHQQASGVMEEGKLTLENYLDYVIFYEKRPFTQAEFQQFMFQQSQPYPDMLTLMTELKHQYGLKIFVVSNESRELNAYRIYTFQLNRFVDAFISSCYVGMRKPDREIYRYALDISQTPPDQIAYIENTSMFVDIAKGFGIHGILHTDTATTCEALSALGLPHKAAVHH